MTIVCGWTESPRRLLFHTDIKKSNNGRFPNYEFNTITLSLFATTLACVRFPSDAIATLIDLFQHKSPRSLLSTSDGRPKIGNQTLFSYLPPALIASSRDFLNLLMLPVRLPACYLNMPPSM